MATIALTGAGKLALAVLGVSVAVSAVGAGVLINSKAVASAKTDFGVSVAPSSQSVQKGGPASYSVSLDLQNGFKDPVAMSATVQSGSGLTTAFAPSTVPAKGTSTTLTVSTSAAAIGTWSVTVTGTSGTLTHSAVVAVTVNYPASQSYTISATPTTAQILPGDTAQYAVSITRTGGYSGAISLAVGGVPSGATGTFSPASPIAGTSTTLQIATTSAAASGTIPLTITASAANQSNQTATVQLVITDKGKPFSISGTSTGSMAPGSPGSAIDLTLTNPNNQAMNITNLTVSVTGTSAGSNCSVSNFTVQQYSGSYPLSLAKNQSISLSGRNIPQAQWPTVRLLNFPTINQDACKGASVYLSFTGAGTG
ncbi:MAG: hypothetical protein QOK42_2071 [Frankiaceae bacterium]|nr:hypothetical protein [Frankiaceae bacterium]